MDGIGKSELLLLDHTPPPAIASTITQENFLRVGRKQRDDLDILQENRNSRLFSGPYEVISLSDEDVGKQESICTRLREGLAKRPFVIGGIVAFNIILGSLIILLCIFPPKFLQSTSILTSSSITTTSTPSLDQLGDSVHNMTQLPL